eukprot:TRINITY_DN36110_c0_g1_i1.p1 TRINITY_DN36110_c0_g1~~TRINITY_DN36110_c0_g1_i1.p1  ORF type:complete len:253 (+),score=33.52 TRINITY_DN36110_c0_g1_i1:259-1017(+)
MAALASLCVSVSRTSFRYYTRRLPDRLRDQPSGNLALALERGMTLCEVTDEEYSRMTTGGTPSSCGLWVPQGGADVRAAEGLHQLAEEIGEFCGGQAVRSWRVLVESGTGASALLLGHAVQNLGLTGVQVMAVPCVGDAAFLKQELSGLGASFGLGVSEEIVKVLDTQHSPRRRFAKPTARHLQIHTELTGVSEFGWDLVYAPRAWELILDQWDLEATQAGWGEEQGLIYLHCGAVESNSSQLERYGAARLL